jgi:hypothetical protein
MAKVDDVIREQRRILEALTLARAAGARNYFLDRIIDDPEYRERFAAAEQRDFVAPPAGFKLLVPRWTLKIDTDKSFHALWEGLRMVSGVHFGLNVHAYDHLNRLSMRRELVPTPIDCYVVSGLDLGFSVPTKPADIFAQAAKSGLCTFRDPRVVPLLRRMYVDQPKGEVLLMAIESSPVQIEHETDGVLWIFPRSETYIEPDRHWIFGRAQAQAA